VYVRKVGAVIATAGATKLVYTDMEWEAARPMKERTVRVGLKMPAVW
jgi:hypothetical protein